MTLMTAADLDLTGSLLCVQKYSCSNNFVLVNGYTVMFSAIFTKGNNFLDFLFASMEDRAHRNGDLHVHFKERICS